ncbi:MAG: phosphoribosyltransferase family protein [Bacteroidales bacterium]|jgi:ComF family protein|nr:phosphoribosyltransferase family protein [Bacteroidales bacterium]
MINSEKVLCTMCLLNLNRSYSLYEENNDLANRVSIYFPVKNAVSLLNYSKDCLASNLIHSFKYNEDLGIGKYLSETLCNELKSKQWINEIDYIIPLPLHWRRKLKRGFNQSEIIAKTIGKYFSKEVKSNYIRRVRNNRSQTKMSKSQRWTNVENIFKLKNPALLEGKHILLVDDIVTTGASLNSCIKTLSKVKDIKISVLVLGQTNH